MSLLLALALFVLGAMITGEAFAGSWFNEDWLYRRQITIDHTKVQNVADPSTTYEDFPLLVFATGLSNINANGTDIRFTASDGTTELPREIESYSSGTLYAWVKVTLTKDSSDSTDDVIYMYYGNPDATEPAPASPNGSENVWDSNFTTVYHLTETSGTHYDSTSNNNDTTSQNNIVNQGTTTAKIIGADEFNGTNSYLGTGGYWNTWFGLVSGNTTGTLEMWIDPTGTGPAGQADCSSLDYFMGDWDAVGGIAQGEVGAGGDLIHVCWIGTPWPTYQSIAMTDAGGYQYVVMTMQFNGTDQVEAFQNGTSQGTITNTCGVNAPCGAPLTVGARRAGIAHIAGYIDEIRFSNTVRSAEWIATKYQNENAPDDFLTVSEQVSIPTMTEWGMIIFMVLAGLGAIYYLRRKRIES
jgi:hypothetical protein